MKDLCGIQAQDASAAALAVRVRSTGLLNDDIERARVQERSVIRTWGQRGTLHLLATEDLGWLLPLPAGLSRPGLVALGAIVATVPLLVCDVLPDYVVMLLLAVALVVPGVVPAADMLGGFAAPAWIMILALLAVGTAVARSGRICSPAGSPRRCGIRARRQPPDEAGRGFSGALPGRLCTTAGFPDIPLPTTEKREVRECSKD